MNTKELKRVRKFNGLLKRQEKKIRILQKVLKFLKKKRKLNKLETPK